MNPNTSPSPITATRIIIYRSVIILICISVSYSLSLYLFGKISISRINEINSFISTHLVLELTIGLLILAALFAFSLFGFVLRYTMSFWQYCTSFVGLIMYLCLRLEFNKTNTVILPVEKYEPVVSYLDVIGLFFVSFVILSLVNTYSSKKKTKNVFDEDTPFIAEQNELYNSIIQKIEPALFADKYEKSFTIGLLGSWGIGKSSFLEYLKGQITESKHYKNNEIIQFSFSPFLNSKEGDIIEEFFTLLAKELRLRNGKISTLLIEYVGSLTSAIKDKNPLFFLLKNFKLDNNKSSHELYDEISSIVKVLNVKTIVIIDDLDRLNENEILEVLKLIRNTSNFPNMVFLLAMDKEYVVDKISDKQNPYFKNYIDKFFQLEIAIDFPKTTSLKTILIQEILMRNSGLSNHSQHSLKIPVVASIIEVFNLELKKSKHYVLDYFRNYRDIKIFINILFSDAIFLNNNYSKIEIREYILFNLLKRKFVDLGNYLCSNYEKILDTKEDGHNPKILELIKTWEDEVNNNYSPPDLTLRSKTINELFVQDQPTFISIANLETFYLVVFQIDFSNEYYTVEELQVLLNDDVSTFNWASLLKSGKEKSFTQVLTNYNPLSAVELFNYGKLILTLRFELTLSSPWVVALEEKLFKKPNQYILSLMYKDTEECKLHYIRFLKKTTTLITERLSFIDIFFRENKNDEVDFLTFELSKVPFMMVINQLPSVFPDRYWEVAFDIIEMLSSKGLNINDFFVWLIREHEKHVVLFFNVPESNTEDLRNRFNVYRLFNEYIKPSLTDSSISFLSYLSYTLADKPTMLTEIKGFIHE